MKTLSKTLLITMLSLAPMAAHSSEGESFPVKCTATVGDKSKQLSVTLRQVSSGHNANIFVGKVKIGSQKFEISYFNETLFLKTIVNGQIQTSYDLEKVSLSAGDSSITCEVPTT